MQWHNPSFQNPMKMLLICIYTMMVSDSIKRNEKMLFKSVTVAAISNWTDSVQLYKTYFFEWALRSPVVTHSINSSIRYEGAWFVISHLWNGKFQRTTSVMTAFPFSLDPNEVK